MAEESDLPLVLIDVIILNDNKVRELWKLVLLRIAVYCKCLSCRLCSKCLEAAVNREWYRKATLSF